MNDTRVIIHIAVKDRPTEIALLLQSLRTQTYQNFDILILDDGSTTPLQNFYFINYMVSRLKLEGHYVKILRSDSPSGVSKARQKLVDYTLQNLRHRLTCRIDDDVILEPDYLMKLLSVIEAGYDIASGITTPFVNPDTKRDVKFVSPIIGECMLDDEGRLIKNGDDCGYNYIQDEILPSHHFRSCAMIKREIFENGVDYNSRLSKNGFREEQVFSFKALLKGYDIGIHTGANARHLMTPSGGERDTMNMTAFNQKIFEDTTKAMFDEHGDFIEKYNKKFKILDRKKSIPKEELSKNTNLVSR